MAAERALVGRDAEWSAVRTFLDGIAVGEAQSLAISGAAGIGKSSLWRAAILHARQHGIRVLDARPTEVEAHLAFAGLHDLVRDVQPGEMGVLPYPQRLALEAALYRGAPATHGDRVSSVPDAGAIAIAVLSLVRSLSGEGPVLIAVDDIQWLDAASLAPLRFVARRLGHEMVGVLVAERADAATREGGGTLLGPDAAAGQVIELGPLSVGALHRLLGERLGVSLARPGLIRLHELTDGNPFVALELVRAWGPDAALAVQPDRALPGTLDDLLAGRVASLSVPERNVAQTVAALGRPTERLVGQVVEDIPDLDPVMHRMVQTGVLRREGDRVRCSHPLLASALIATLSPSARRRLHADIARILDDPIERAPHLAAAADGPDATVAASLDAAADAAQGRGATVEASGLRELAVGLTPGSDGAALGRRRVSLADALFTAGDTVRASHELRAVDPDAIDLDTRLEAGLLRATILWFDDQTPQAVELAEAVLAGAGDDQVWQARIHARLSWMLDYDVARQAAHGAAAMRLLEPAADPITYAFAALNQAWARLLAGDGADEAAVALGERLQEEARSWEYSTIPAVWAKCMDRFERARGLIRHYLAQGEERGDESSVPQLLSMLAEVECWTGHMTLAQELGEASVLAAEQSGQAVYRSTSLARRAYVRACLGDLDGADTDARASLALAVPPLTPPVPLGVLGFVTLTRGDPAAAVAHLRAAADMLDSVGIREPAPYRLHGDLIEALILVGDLAGAEVEVDRLESRARLVPRPWAEAVSARSRALLLAAKGDVAGAIVAFDRALVAHGELGMPLELGRTQLTYGIVLRRAGSRRRASASLNAAIETFQGIGCEPWAVRARAELSRVGLQRQSSADTLTPSEERIARLAASGMTNRLIAERLVISPKTVEASLARAYQKLGIHSRAELGAWVASDTGTTSASLA